MNLHRLILDMLAGMDKNSALSIDVLVRALRKKTSPDLDRAEVLEALWQLLSQGLVVQDYPGTDPHPWILSKRGQRVVRSEDEYEPDDPDGYLETLRARIPELDELVLLYTREALGAYASRLYLASSVMLGVASERAFQLLGESFARWLDCVSPQEGKRFRKIFDNPRANYISKFQEFRKRIEPRKGDLPTEFTDNMALNLDSMFDLLRVDRNEAGHPTGRRFERADVYSNLRVFAFHLGRVYKLMAFLDGGSQP